MKQSKKYCEVKIKMNEGNSTNQIIFIKYKEEENIERTLTRMIARKTT